MLPLHRDSDPESILIPVLLEQKIVELCLKEDPFNHLVWNLKKDRTIDSEWLERIKPPELLCWQKVKHPIRTYQDLTLKSDHPLFKKINEVVNGLNTLSLEEKKQKRIEKLIQLYMSYVKDVCLNKGKARFNLLKGSARLYGLSEKSYLLSHERARLMTSNDIYGEIARTNQFGLNVVSQNGVCFNRMPAKLLSPGMKFVSDSFNCIILLGLPSISTELIKIQNIWIKSAFDASNQSHPARKALEKVQAQGTSISQYFLQNPRMKEVYPFKEKRIDQIVQASYPIEGTNLWEIMKCEEHPDIDSFNFSAICLFGICLGIPDGHAANFIVKKRFIGINNNRCFAPLFIKDKEKHLLNFRFVLFFLPHMQSSVDAKFCKHIQHSSLELLFLEWIHTVCEKNREYQTLTSKGFTYAEMKDLELPIKLTRSSLQKSYQILLEAKTFFTVHSDCTHWELVKQLNPYITILYQKILVETGNFIEAQKRLFDQKNPIYWESYFSETCPLAPLPEKKEDPYDLLLKWIETLHFQNKEQQERFLENLFLFFPETKRLAFHCILDNQALIRIFSRTKDLQELTLLSFKEVSFAGLKELSYHIPFTHLIVGIPSFSPEECAQYVRQGWETECLFLIRLKENTVSLKKEEVQSFFLQALQAGNFYWAQVSLHLGAQAKQVGEDGSLFHRFATADVSVIRFLIRAEVPLNVKNKRGQTSLHIAVIRYKKNNVRALLKAGVHKDEKDHDGKTPLHLAVGNGDQEMVSLLLKKNANLFVLTHEKQSAFHIAASYGYAALLKLLFSHIKEPHGILNQKDWDGKTPLHHAVCGNPKPECAKILLENGADPNAQNNYHFTPLHWAAKHGHLKSMHFLLENGADPLLVNQNGDAPIELALRCGQDEIVRYLISPEKAEPSENNCRPDDFKHPEEIYYLQLEKNFEMNQPIEMVFFLEKMGDLAIQNEAYLRASHLLNAALTISEKHSLNYAHQKSLFFRLERIERLLLEKLFKANSPAGHRNHVKSMRVQLQTLRTQVQRKLEANESADSIQQFFSKKIQDLLFTWIAEIMQLIKTEPPIPFAALALGSCARNELCPFSNIKLAFLIQKNTPEALDYFRRLSLLLELRITSLGETKWEIIKPRRTDTGWSEAKSLTPSGFSMDNGGFSSWGKESAFELIGTPDQLAAYQDLQWLQKNEGESLIVNALTQVQRIFGEKKLLAQYKKALNQWLDKKTRVSRFKFKTQRKIRALQLLRGFLEDFKPCLTEEYAELRAFDIKKVFYRPLQMAIGGLLFYYGLESQNTMQGIALLQKEKVFTPEGAHNLRAALNTILRLRMQTHLFYKMEKEIIYCLKKEENTQSNEFFLIQESDSRLVEIYETLIPFYHAVQNFILDRKQLNHSFLESTLGHFSLEDEKNLNFEEALSAYSQIFFRNPEDPEALDHMQRIKTYLGDANKSLKYNEEYIQRLKDKYGNTPHPKIVNALDSMGMAYSELGKPQIAIEYHKEALVMIHQLSSFPHERLAATLRRLGKTYAALGDMKKSMEYDQQALDVQNHG